MGSPEHVTIVAGHEGRWRIDLNRASLGQALPYAKRLEIVEGAWARPEGAAWVLRGFASNTRYTTADERARLRAVSPALGRSEATSAALIPIRKSPAWWDLAQDERRRILEEDSRHISIGAEYLTDIARRLLHCRDLGEPFDFLTWFEYPPHASGAFEELVARLRATREWGYVEHEIDIRLTRDPV